MKTFEKFWKSNIPMYLIGVWVTATVIYIATHNLV